MMDALLTFVNALLLHNSLFPLKILTLSMANCEIREETSRRRDISRHAEGSGSPCGIKYV
jgi:hypothetical protein